MSSRCCQSISMLIQPHSSFIPHSHQSSTHPVINAQNSTTCHFSSPSKTLYPHTFLLLLFTLQTPKTKTSTTTMASTKTSSKTTLLLPLCLFFFFFLNLSESILTLDYYKQTCPQFEQIVQQTVTSKQIQSPTTAAATLRLFLHDCLLPNGCDASVLLSSTPFNKAERDNDINLSLPGDAFDLIVRIKTALEFSCPSTVSCSDILATATRDLLIMLGGPHYNVYLGRRDGTTSASPSVNGHLPKPSMPMSQIIGIFTKRGFTVEEMVALSGAHTVGFSHCSEFSSEIYNNSSSPTSYNPRFVEALRNACRDYQKNPTLSIFNDVMTPNKFDNVYFQNLPKGLGVLKSDHGLFTDPLTKPFVERFAADEDRFFKVFASSMQKLSLLGVKTGRRGEIRRRCDQIN